MSYTPFYGERLLLSLMYVLRLLRLLAMGMELPEDTFVNIHGYETPNDTWGKCPLSTHDSTCS